MTVEHIGYTENLKSGTDKLNQAIDQSNDAITKHTATDLKADNAVETANEANAKSDDTQVQLNAVVNRETDSDAMSAQAAVDANGVNKVNLKKRLDDDYNEVTSKLAERPTKDEARLKSELIDDVDVSQNLRNMITGTTPVNNAVPATNSIEPTMFTEKVRNNLYPFHQSATLKHNKTSPDSILPLMRAIKRIELYGTDTKKQYYVDSIYRKVTEGANLTSLFYVFCDGVRVAAFYQWNYTETSGVDVISLVQSNSSGITGKVWIDWSQIASGIGYFGMNYVETGIHIDATNASVKKEQIPVKTIERTMLEDMIVNNLYPFQPYATLKAENDGNSLNYIRKAFKRINLYGADPNKKYSIREIVRQSNLWCLRIAEVTDTANVKMVCELNVSNLVETGATQEVTVSEYNSSGIYAKILIDWSQILLNSNWWNMFFNSTGIHTLCYLPTDLGITYDMLLPKKIYTLLGKEMNIYLDNIFNSEDIKDFYINVNSGMTGLKLQNERLNIVPTAAGNNNADFILTKNKTTLKTLSTSIITKDGATVGAGLSKKCLFIGESTTEQLYYLQELKNLFDNDPAGMRIQLLGTRGTAPILHEGRSGWSYTDYTTLANKSGVTNAFWDGTQFNFSNYMTTSGLAVPNYVFICLGINGAGTDMATVQAKYDIMVNSIKAYNSNIKIGIMVTIPPAYTQDGFGKQTGLGAKRVGQKPYAFSVAKQLLTGYEGRESENIYIVPTNVNLDTINNFPTEIVAANSRTTNTIVRQTDHVHPASSGYYQISDTLYYFMKCQEI